MARVVVKRDEKGRIHGHRGLGALPEGQRSEVVRVTGRVEAIEAFARLEPRERGRVIAAWWDETGGKVPT